MYSSHADKWEDHATVRNRPRRIIEDDELKFYPVDRQPLLSHPEIRPTDIEAIEIQSLYKYLNDVIIFETEIVDKTARQIARGRFPFEFSGDVKLDAMSVVVDEDYHAYVAIDYMNQLVEDTGVEPILLPEKIELSEAIPLATRGLDEERQAGMELLAVAISENTITLDVAAFSKDATVKRSVKGLMADHLADEARHASFWTKIFAVYWRSIDEDSRLELGKRLPMFLERYLINELQNEFDLNLLKSLGYEGDLFHRISSDLVTTYPIGSNHPMVVNIWRFFEKSGILEHAETKQALNEHFKDERVIKP